jgi:hypothetical protein
MLRQRAEYRYQKAMAEDGKLAEALMKQQRAEIAEKVDQNSRIPDSHKAVARLAVRDELTGSDRAIAYEEVRHDLREAMSDVDAFGGKPSNFKGSGIGGFFGRLFNGRITEAQRRRHSEATTSYTDANGGFGGLNSGEKAALQAYRDGVDRDRPKGREAVAVAEAIGDHGRPRRPRRYRAVESAMQEIEGHSGEYKADDRAKVYTEGLNGLGLGTTGEGGTVKPSKLIEGEGDTPSAQDATYRLGWASYAVFRKTPAGLFQGVSGAQINPLNEKDANGNVVVGTVEPNGDMLEGKEFGQITTAGVTACSVIIIKKGDQYAMLHLDAKHTEPGEARDFLLTQMTMAFRDVPGDVEIMESIRKSGECESQFCDALHAQLGEGGSNKVRVQRLDRDKGKTASAEFIDDPPGHLEIGITPQDVVFGDRADVSRTDPPKLHVVPVEWRLGAPQDAVETIWKDGGGSYREFTSTEDAQKHADDLAKKRVEQMEQTKNGIPRPEPEGSVRGLPGMEEARRVDAMEQTRVEAQARDAARRQAQAQAAAPQQEQAASQRAQAQAQAQAAAPQREQAQTQAAAPRREHISRDDFDATVRPHTSAAPAGRKRAASMREPAATHLAPAENQHQHGGRSAGN